MQCKSAHLFEERNDKLVASLTKWLENLSQPHYASLAGRPLEGVFMPHARQADEKLPGGIMTPRSSALPRQSTAQTPLSSARQGSGLGKRT